MSSLLESNTTSLQSLLDEVNNLPNAGSGGGSVQTDWNQTDDTAPDFLKNKPFGDTETSVVPLGEYEFVFSEENAGAAFITPFNITLTTDDVIRASFAGVTYDCTPLIVYGQAYFGNLGPLGMEDTGEPFVGLIAEGVCMVMDIFSAETVTRSFSLSTVRREKIDPAYVPDNITKFYIVSTGGGYLYSDEGCTKLVTLDIALKALTKSPIVFIFMNAYFFYPDNALPGNNCLIFNCGDIKFYTAEYTE